MIPNIQLSWKFSHENGILVRVSRHDPFFMIVFRARNLHETYSASLQDSNAITVRAKHHEKNNQSCFS